MTTRTMSKTQRSKFEKHLEEQGCDLRTIAGGGWIIRFPDGGSTTVHTTSSDIRSTRNAIALFRRHGIQHPNDPKEIAMPENDADYPDYMTGPIAGTTRKRVLSALERLGWPVVVLAQELPMDTVTAHRALYAVGYRLDPKSTTRKRIWNAPEDIVQLHEKVKADQAERADEARAQRLAAHEAAVMAAAALTPDADPEEEEEEQGLIGVVMPPTVEPPSELLRDGSINISNAEGAVITRDDEGNIIDVRNITREEVEAYTKVREVKPEREFIDSVDSWTVETGGFSGVPVEVREYLAGLRAAGLSAEIRVWRA